MGAGFITALACALYLPFLSNPRVFDDWVFFSGEHFYYYATHPFGLRLRLLPYFSLAITEVMIGGMPAHRIVSLLVHVCSSLILFKLIHDLLRTLPSSDPDREMKARTWAFVTSAFFAVHPVAVYAAGYLVERTVVVATLFSLASVSLFLRGLRRGGNADAFWAALMYSIAVVSKENSVLLPAATVLMVFVVATPREWSLRYAGRYLAICAPAAIFVLLVRKGMIGVNYEPSFSLVSSQMEDVFGTKDLSLSTSIVTQAGLFFRYLASWLVPNTGYMSVDLRVDFPDASWSGLALLKLTAFVAYGAAAFTILRRGGRAGVLAFGLLYAWVLFLAEFATGRFQEPLVLYRSYLWAPGWAVALAAACSKLPARAAIAAAVLGCSLLMFQARDRLITFSSSLALWEDAVEKLPEKPVPWGSRTLYMAGREYVYGGQPDKAMALAERCIAQYPHTVHCMYARGIINYLMDQPAKALPDLRAAVELAPDFGISHHRLGLVLERLGRIEQAKSEYREAVRLGFGGAAFELRRLESRSGRPPRSKDVSADSHAVDMRRRYEAPAAQPRR